MKIIFFIFLSILTNQMFGQLKGAVPQADAPSHINEQRKEENKGAASLAKNNAAKLKKSLKLTDKQHEDLFKALLDYETNVEKTTKSKLSKKDQFNKLNQLNMAKQDKMKAILTKEQYHAYIMSFP
mgnify:FL=1|jgi:uncharacterized membrane protein YgaE (UPF0421/DUF939 family)